MHDLHCRRLAQQAPGGHQAERALYICLRRRSRRTILCDVLLKNRLHSCAMQAHEPIECCPLKSWASFCCLQAVRAEAKDIWFDNSSRKKLQDGINKVADAVGVTLGPRGAPCALLLNNTAL